MFLHDKIKTERKKRGLTQADLAREIGITRQTLINWEKGVTQPNHAELEQMSSFFNTKFDIDVKGNDVYVRQDIIEAKDKHIDDLRNTIRMYELIINELKATIARYEAGFIRNGD